MGFPKAAQLVKTPEYLEYLECLIKFKKSSSEHKRVCVRYKDSEIESERVMYLLSKDKHSKISKAYYAAQKKYIMSQAAAEIQRRGGGIRDEDILKMLGIKIPLSMQELVKAEQTAALERSITPEQRKVIEDAARAYASRPKSVKEQFLTQDEKNADDPLFENLREDSSNVKS